MFSQFGPAPGTTLVATGAVISTLVPKLQKKQEIIFELKQNDKSK